MEDTWIRKGVLHKAVDSTYRKKKNEHFVRHNKRFLIQYEDDLWWLDDLDTGNAKLKLTNRKTGYIKMILPTPLKFVVKCYETSKD